MADELAAGSLRFRQHLALCALLFLILLAGGLEFPRKPHRRVKLAAAAAPDTLRSGSTGSHLKAAPVGLRHERALMEQSSVRMNDDDDDFNIVAATLDFIGAYLPELNFNYTIISKEFTNQQLDIDVENYYRRRFAANMTIEQLQLEAIKASLRTAPMPIHTSWGYESRAQLKLGSSPVQDDERCSAHLSQLANRLEMLTSNVVAASNADAAAPAHQPVARMGGAAVASAYEASPVENFEAAQVYKSTDLLFLRYLDTFGKVPSDLLRGNVKWYGSYSGCLDTKLPANVQMGGTRRIKFRYCMAALKSVGWQQATKGKPSSEQANYGVHTKDVNLQNYFIRIGACLPESCDSSALDYQHNWHNIEKLIKFNLMKPFNSNHYYLSDLYCIPDERSPLRSIPLAGKLLILISVCWMALIGLATTVHLNVERFYTKAVKKIRRKQLTKKLVQVDSDGSISGLSSSSAEKDIDHNNEFEERDILGLKRYWIRLNVYLWDNSQKLIKDVDLIACFSLYSNWLKYTNRMKVAIVQLHTEQERRQRIKARNKQLVDCARKSTRSNLTNSAHHNNRDAKITSTTPSSTLNNQNRSGQKVAGAGDSVSGATNGEGSENNGQERENQLFDRELNKRIKAQDDSDELDSDNIKRRVDTSSLNALKVIALLWIIAGHCIFYLGSTISNDAILMNYVRDLAAFALANGALYITELFFVITGCLTAYLAFKYNTYRQPVSSNNDSNELETGQELRAQASGAGAGGEDQASASQFEARFGGRKRLELDSSSDHLNESNQQTVACLESRIFKLPFWIMIVINRYLRILPTYLLVYCFVKLVSIYIGGHGQLWDYAVSQNSMRRSCVQESWLPVLTLTTNFVDIYGHCIVGGWYLSTDMQFMLISVPFLLILAYCQRGNKRSKVTFKKNQQQLTFIQQQTGSSDPTATTTTSISNEIRISKARIFLAYSIIFTFGLISATSAIVYGILHSEVDYSYILKFVPHTIAILSRNIAMYTNSIFRFRAFGLGLILGHLLYLYEFKLIRLPKFVQQHGSKLTTIVFSIGFGIMFIPVIYPEGKIIVSHDLTSILMILSAGGIDIFLCILIFLICIGKAPKVVLFFLNSPFWTLLSSLSLCAFLIHSEIIILLTSQLNPPPTAQYSLLLFVFSATLILTYLLALALYLSFEMPVSRLIEALMRKYFATSKLARSDNSNLHQ